MRSLTEKIHAASTDRMLYLRVKCIISQRQIYDGSVKQNFMKKKYSEGGQEKLSWKLGGSKAR